MSLSGMEVAPDLRKIDPLALATEEPAMVAAQTRVAGVRERQHLPVFVHLRSGNQVFPGKIRSLGGEAVKVHARLYTGTLPRDAARYVSLWPEVAYIEADRLAYPMLDFSGPAISADAVHQGLPAWPSPFDNGVTGAGVFVGVVDSGLSSGHLDFFENGNPSLPRVDAWYPNEATASVDVIGHGTHVAGIAAGNGFLSGGEYTGMAPDASLLVAKTTFSTLDIQNAVANLLEIAGTTPVAINLSLGSLTGPHDGSSGFENAIGFYATNGVSPGGKQIIVAAAGNERDGEGHFKTIVTDLFGTKRIDVELSSTLSPLPLPQVDIWAYGTINDPDFRKRTEYDEYTVTVTFPGESVTVPSGRRISSSQGGITVSNRVDTSVPNGATHITLKFSQSLAGQTGRIRFDRTRNGGTGVIDGYVDFENGRFLVPETSGTITEPANADNVIAVGSFNTKTFRGDPDSEEISVFSSLGPTRDGRIKPDITAPGFVIYSTRSFDAPTGNYFGIVSGNDNYAILGGTSMASPHIAGIAALVWESNPTLTGAQMRGRLRRTADPPTDGSQTPNNTWGTGKVNALRAVGESVASITAPASSLPSDNVLLTSENSSGAFGNPLTGFSWILTPPAGSSASLGSTTAASTSFTPDDPGDYRVDLTVSQADPVSTPPGIAAATIHVNTLPVAVIDGPASDNTGLPVTFTGSGSSARDVGQALTYRWVLVSRPTGSSATLLPSGADNATMTADVEGPYEVGLRVDDGLDNSALVTKSYTALVGSVSGSGGGGGGGCVIGSRNSEDDGASSLAALLLLLGPLGMLAARRRGYRFLLHRGSTTPSPRR